MTNRPRFTFMLIGVIGLSITLSLNLVGLLFLRQIAAEFFSEKWWSVWFPSYVVWLVIAVIGSRSMLTKR